MAGKFVIRQKNPDDPPAPTDPVLTFLSAIGFDSLAHALCVINDFRYRRGGRRVLPEGALYVEEQ